MKKFLSVVLSLVTLLSGSGIMAYAEDTQSRSAQGFNYNGYCYLFTLDKVPEYIERVEKKIKMVQALQNRGKEYISPQNEKKIHKALLTSGIIYAGVIGLTWFYNKFFPVKGKTEAEYPKNMPAEEIKRRIQKQLNKDGYRGIWQFILIPSVFGALIAYVLGVTQRVLASGYSELDIEKFGLERSVLNELKRIQDPRKGIFRSYKTDEELEERLKREIENVGKEYKHGVRICHTMPNTCKKSFDHYPDVDIFKVFEKDYEELKNKPVCKGQIKYEL